jgi:transposase
VLVEISVVEQRYQAVLAVLDGSSVTEVANRFGVHRQTVHRASALSRCHVLLVAAGRSHGGQQRPALWL